MLYDVGALIWCFWGSLEGNDGMGSGREVQEEGLWLIHVAIWSKPTQYHKAIILQLKIN